MALSCGFAFFCLLAVLAVLSFLCEAAPQNVTLLLDNHPGYSTFNRLLSEYGVAQHINSRTTLTVLCPPNSALDSFLGTLGSSPDPQSLYNILSFHVLLDYKDPAMLASLPRGSTRFTTLFQTTGLATGDNGFLNITVDRATRKPVATLPGISAAVGQSLELFPYNISLLSVDKVLVPPGVIGSPPSPPVNVTLLLTQAGSVSRFLGLLSSSGVDKVYQSHVTPPGVTIFAPSDAAFGRLTPKLAAEIAALPAAKLQALLEGHALTSFYQEQELESAHAPLPTLAGGAVSVVLSGVVRTVDAGGSKANVTASQSSNFPVSIFAVDNVLISRDLLAHAAGPAAPAPSTSSPPLPTPSTSSAPLPTPSTSSPPSPTPSSSLPPSPASTPSSSPTPSLPPLPLSPPSPSPPAPSPRASEDVANGPDALAPNSPPASSSPASPFPSFSALFLASCTMLVAFSFFP